jgi:hypothetical protein
LLTFVVGNIVTPLLDHVPHTFAASAWYSGSSWTILAIIAALALYAYKVAVAGRPAFGGSWVTAE